MQFFNPLSNTRKHPRVIQSKYQGNILTQHIKITNRVKLDWRNSNKVMRNDNPLIQILEHMTTATDDLYRTYLYAIDNAYSLSGMFGFINSSSKPRFLTIPYFFLDDNCPEVIINVNREESHNLVVEQLMDESIGYWRDWEPIRVRYHPYTDMDYYPMCTEYENTPRKHNNPYAIAIIEVDIPLLYLQFLLWNRSPDSRLGEGKKSIHMFMMNYPIPNAIESQMEIAYFNRMEGYFLEKPIVSNRPLHKRHTYIATYQNIDNSILEIKRNLKKQGGLSFEKLSRNLPSLLLDHDCQDLFKLPDIPMRKQHLAVLGYMITPLYLLWLNLIKQYQQQRWNTNEIADLKKGLKILNIENVFVHPSGKGHERIPFLLNQLGSQLEK